MVGGVRVIGARGRWGRGDSAWRRGAVVVCADGEWNVGNDLSAGTDASVRGEDVWADGARSVVGVRLACACLGGAMSADEVERGPMRAAVAGGSSRSGGPRRGMTCGVGGADRVSCESGARGGVGERVGGGRVCRGGVCAVAWAAAAVARARAWAARGDRGAGGVVQGHRGDAWTRRAFHRGARVHALGRSREGTVTASRGARVRNLTGQVKFPGSRKP